MSGPCHETLGSRTRPLDGAPRLEDLGVIDPSALDGRFGGAVVLGGVYDAEAARMVSSALHLLLDAATNPAKIRPVEERGFVAALTDSFLDLDVKAVDTTLKKTVIHRGGTSLGHPQIVTVPGQTGQRMQMRFDGTQSERLPDEFVIVRDLARALRPLRQPDSWRDDGEPPTAVEFHLWSLFLQSRK